MNKKTINFLLKYGKSEVIFMFEEKNDGIEFISTKGRNKFIKDVQKALDEENINKKDYKELRELFK